MFNERILFSLSSTMIVEAAGPSESSVDFIRLQSVTIIVIFMAVSVRTQCRAKYHRSVNTQ
jgi:hypothetical protein